MLATPGCCARDDMGAAFAGVFCGVLVGGKYVSVRPLAEIVAVIAAWGWNVCVQRRGRAATYGADIESSFLLRMGSDMVAGV
jgi:hypothetical protein